jgi:sporulation protein YlmC with PRC-barrel domain
MRRYSWVSLATAGYLVAATSGAAANCLDDVRVFDHQMEIAGYWMGGSASVISGGNDEANSDGFRSLRSSHELRVLVASAVILAGKQQEQRCRDVLASAQEIYRQDGIDKSNSQRPVDDVEDWRRQQIASAQLVSNTLPFYRADEFIGTEVRDPRGAALGRVADVIQLQRTGKIGYLVIDRGGVFGFGNKLIAVPWADFRVTPTATLFVLDTTQAVLDNAPSGYKEYLQTPAAFALQAQKIDVYWTAQQPGHGTN